MFRNRWVVLALKFGVSILGIWFAARGFNLTTAAARITDLGLGVVLAVFGLFGALFVNNTLRWQTVLAAIGVRLRFLTALRLLDIGVFFTHTLPSSVGGDAIRCRQ